ncbi:MAG: response regulator [Actinomycetota bacterium]
MLIADDVPALRAMVRRILERDGRFEVIGEAQDGIEAVHLAGQLQPQVVVLDLMMPRKDGATALAEIRRVSPASRVVILTGVGGAAQPDVDADAWLDKGTSPHDMIRALEGLVATA